MTAEVVKISQLRNESWKAQSFATAISTGCNRTFTKKCEKKSAPDPDGIPLKVVKAAALHQQQKVLSTMNDSLLTERFPFI